MTRKRKPQTDQTLTDAEVLGDRGEVKGIREPARTCRSCGCTDDRACQGGCYWVLPDLCSTCAFKAAPEVLSIRSIKVSADGRQGKDEGLDDLQASIASQGLLQPIGVMACGEKPPWYRLVFGRRRLAAARALGWTHITAQVYPDSGERGLAQLSAVENLQRQDLNPVEEAVAVAMLLEQITGGKKWGPQMTREASVSMPAAAIDAAAAVLGKSPAWVKDRMILLRLAPRVRTLVGEGRIHLGHAKELAKVADPRTQENLAERAALEKDRTGRIPETAEVRDWVVMALADLNGVRWELEVPFAGKRACAGCPHHSTVARGLFADIIPEKGKGTCLDPGCYQHKREAADRAIDDLVKKAAKDKAIPSTATALKDLAEPGLKVTAAVRQVKKARGEGPEPPKKPGPRETEAPPDPERELREALHLWRRKIEDAVMKAKVLTPLRFLAIGAAGHCRPIQDLDKGADWNSTHAQRVKAWAIRLPKAKPWLERLARATAVDVEELATEALKTVKDRRDILPLPYRAPPEAFRMLCEAWGVPWTEPPTLEQFQPKAKAKPAAKNGADPWANEIEELAKNAKLTAGAPKGKPEKGKKGKKATSRA